MGDITVEDALKALSESGTKYVPESDLIAAKKGLESKLAETQANLATSRSDLDSKHQDVLRLQAAVKEAEGKLSSDQASKDKLADLEKQLKEATDGRDALANQIIGLRRLHIFNAAGGKIQMADLEKKDASQLSALEEALKLVGVTTGSQTFDGGHTAAGGPVHRIKGRSLIKEGLAQGS